MAGDVNSPKEEGRYDIMQNAKGDILIMIDSREGGPENPKVVYDGGDTIILFRSHDSSVILNDINEQAKNPIKMVDEVLVVEIENDDVTREYKVPLRIVTSVQSLLQL